jgi:inosine-uridine nucleoside N-ribohydrolase
LTGSLRHVKGWGRLAAAFGVAVTLSVSAEAGTPVRIVFDTDMGNDIDDALALGLIHALQSRGEAQLLAVTITKDNRWSAPFVDAVNAFYGRPGIPIGVVKHGVTPEDSKYCRVALESGRYPHSILDGREAPDAAGVLRDVLAAQPDASVVIVQVGFSTNLARLLDSPGGRDLAARKVRLLVTMAGWFPTGAAEYNVKMDIPSARKVFGEWPTPLVTSGFEVGRVIKYPASSIERDFAWTTHHPIVDAYRAYMKMPYDRETWDLTAVLYALRPEAGYFGLSPAGDIAVDDKGVTSFSPRPGGTRRYLSVDPMQRARILEAFLYLATQPTNSGGRP